MSDHSLRAALEELAGELEYDVSGAPAKIRAVLAAHPAEYSRERKDAAHPGHDGVGSSSRSG